MNHGRSVTLASTPLTDRLELWSRLIVAVNAQHSRSAVDIVHFERCSTVSDDVVVIQRINARHLLLAGTVLWQLVIFARLHETTMLAADRRQRHPRILWRSNIA